MRRHLFPPIIGLTLLFLTGCAAPKSYRTFSEAARQHPGQSAVIRGVPSFSDTTAHADFAPLAAVLQFWDQPVSAGHVERWYADHSTALSAEDRPVLYAWERGLWAYGQHGSAETLKARLRAGIPIIVILQPRALDETTRRFAVIIGYDDVEEKILYHAGGREPVAASYADFSAAWRTTFNWMLTVCPPEKITWTPDPAELAGRGQFNEVNGRIEEAVSDYEAAIAAGMQKSSLLVRLGNGYRSLGNAEKAEEAYRKAIALDDHNGRAYNNLAYLLAERSESLDEAVSLARQAMLLEPANPMAIDTLGFALFQQGRYQEACDVLERARARARSSSLSAQTEIGLHLVRAHVKAGNPHLAREVLADVLKRNPKASIPPDLRKLADAQ